MGQIYQYFLNVMILYEITDDMSNVYRTTSQKYTFKYTIHNSQYLIHKNKCHTSHKIQEFWHYYFECKLQLFTNCLELP
jgi:hypothetical protein